MKAVQSRGGLALGATAALALCLAGTASAATKAWSLTPATAILTQGEAQTLAFTAANADPSSSSGGPGIACISLTVPSSFAVAASDVIVPSDGSWTAGTKGSAVEIRAAKAAAALGYGDAVTFTLRLVPGSLGGNIVASAYTGVSCSGTAYGSPQLITLTVMPPPTPIATPTPTPRPTTTPTPTPPISTIRPTPIATPTPTPTATRTPTPTPSASPTPTPTPGSTGGGSTSRPDPTPKPTPTPTPSPGAGWTVTAGHQDPGAGAIADLGMGLTTADVTWFVPAAAVSGPGVAVIVWVVLQTVGGTIFLPLVRRFRRGGRTPGTVPLRG